MQKYLEDRGEVTFEKIFSQKLGEYGGGSANPRASAPPPSPAARPGGGGRRTPGLPLYATPANRAVCPLSAKRSPVHRGQAQGSQGAPLLAAGPGPGVSQPLAVTPGGP